jgi:hypothetical protein
MKKGRPVPGTRLRGLRWVPVPLALLVAALGLLVMGSVQGRAAADLARHPNEAGGLSLSVDTMNWMSNDMGGSGDPSAAPPPDDSYSMPSSMMPGMQAVGDNRLRVYRKTNIHIHFVQFDPQASDGVITGLSFEQSVRPITAGELGETTLTAAAPAGATQITVASTSGLRVGVSIEIGQANADTEIATAITAINGNTVTLNAPLQNAHAAGEFTGVEFVQYRWYSDVDDGTLPRPRGRAELLGPRPVRRAHHRASGLNLPQPGDRGADQQRPDRRHLHHRVGRLRRAG